MAERRSDAGVEGLAVEASRNLARRKFHPLTVDEKAEKVRVETERRNVACAEFLAVEAARLSGRRKTNPSTVEQKAKKLWRMQSVIDNLGFVLSGKHKILVLRPKDGMRKIHKLQLFDYLISVIVMRLDLRRLLITLLQMLHFQTRY